jgi:hypothetical protein
LGFATFPDCAFFAQVDSANQFLIPVLAVSRSKHFGLRRTGLSIDNVNDSDDDVVPRELEDWELSPEERYFARRAA